MYGGVLTKETKNCMLSDVRYGNLGTIAPKYKIGTKVAICSGPPNSLVQPVDTYGMIVISQAFKIISGNLPLLISRVSLLQRYR